MGLKAFNITQHFVFNRVQLEQLYSFLFEYFASRCKVVFIKKNSVLINF